MKISDLAAGLEADDECDVDLEVLDRLGRPVHASKLFNSGVHPDAGLRTREGYEWRAPTTTRSSASSTWWASRCCCGSGWTSSRRAIASCFIAPPDPPSPTSRPGDLSLAVLLGAFVVRGLGLTSGARASTTSIGTTSTASSRPTTSMVGGARYVSERTIASGSTLLELDVQNTEALQRSALAPLRGSGAALPSACRTGLGAVVLSIQAGLSAVAAARATALPRCCRGARSRCRTRHTARASAAMSSSCSSSSASCLVAAVHTSRVAD